MTQSHRADDSLLQNHIDWEEKNSKITNERMERLEQELHPLKKMYFAVVGAGSVLSLLLATLLYIYDSDKRNADAMQKSIRETQDAIIRQGAALEKMLYMHQELERDLRREIAHVGAEKK